jgi:hypothetical protein
MRNIIKDEGGGTESLVLEPREGPDGIMRIGVSIVDAEGRSHLVLADIGEFRNSVLAITGGSA